MNGSQKAKSVAQSALDPFETLSNQLLKPMGEEAGRELGAFFGVKKLSSHPQELGAEDLARARQQAQLEKNITDEKNQSETGAKNIAEQIAIIKQDYSRTEQKTAAEQSSMKKELEELQEEIVGLAKASGLNTNAHLESTPKKIGILDIRRLSWIIRFLRINAEESKSGKDLVAQRSNAKRTTGMLAWVSGKQMKVHEQGTLTLQG